MRWPWSQKSSNRAGVHAAYRAVVAEARQPYLFTEMGVEDTITGRFEMVSLHLGLFLRRLRRQGATAEQFAQALFDLFFDDLDRTVRELGVGDISVPKRISKMGSAFYGGLAALTEALDGPDGNLEAVLARNIYADANNSALKALAAHVRHIAQVLDAARTEDLLAGMLPKFREGAGIV